MRKAGYALTGLGIAAALLWSYLGRDDAGIMAVGVLAVFAGMMLLAINAMMRMSRGELLLRPFDALKLFPLLFIGMLAVIFALRLIMPSSLSAVETVGLVSFMSVFFSIYSTLYRKPA